MTSISNRVAQSSVILLLIQLIQRSLGIISTLILARLLMPEHFGIVALVAIALHFFEILADAGNQHYIIQKSEVSDADLNTAWTLDVLIKTCIAFLIIISAPSFALYFNTPELSLALCVASLALPLRALRNPGLMLLAKHMNYKPVFGLNICQKLLSFITVIGIALLWPSYWAIIAGNLVAAIVLSIGSYYVHPFRPTLNLQNIREQWSFSKWLMLRGFVGFIRSQIDSLIVSKIAGTSSLGGYHLVRELSVMPALSVIIPASEPLQAAIADNKEQQQALQYRTRVSLALMTILLTPVTVFMMYEPELIVRVLLGPTWQEYALLLQPFALFFFTFCLFSLVSSAYLAIGAVRELFIFDLISTAIIVFALLLIANPTLSDLAWSRGILAILTTLALMEMLNRKTHFGWFKLLLLCLPAIVASLIGLLILWLTPPPALPLFLLLCTNSLLFFSSFVVVLLLMHILLGKISYSVAQLNRQLWQLLPYRGVFRKK